jgi:hypothetical protein
VNKSRQLKQDRKGKNITKQSPNKCGLWRICLLNRLSLAAAEEGRDEPTPAAGTTARPPETPPTEIEAAMTVHAVGDRAEDTSDTTGNRTATADQVPKGKNQTENDKHYSTKNFTR